jgi:hypothetical protein
MAGSVSSPAVDADGFASFVAGAAWTYARTMPETPHEYTLRRQHDELTFERAVAYVRAAGYDARWKGRRNRYLEHDGWRYWTLGAPLAATVVLNRARVDEPRSAPTPVDKPVDN